MNRQNSVVAIRALEGFERVKIGDVLSPSKRWENHRDTGETLPGVCAFGFHLGEDNAYRAALRWKVTLPADQIRRFALLAGEIVAETTDRTIENLEVVVRDAVVVSILEFRNGSFREVC